MRMLAILVVAVAAFQAAPLSAAELVPHEAEYKETLVRHRNGGELVEGYFRNRLSRDCKKWKMEGESQSKFTIDGQYEEWRTTWKYYEALDGSRMEYDVKYEVDGDIMERMKGSATLEGPGKPGTATYRIPRKDSEELPAGTMFWIAARATDLGNMAAGKKQWTRVVYEAGDLLKIVFSVKKRGATAPASPAGDTDLLSGATWLVESKIYDRQSDEVDQVNERTFHGSGVVSRELKNLGFMIHRYDLVRIERLPTPQC